MTAPPGGADRYCSALKTPQLGLGATDRRGTGTHASGSVPRSRRTPTEPRATPRNPAKTAKNSRSTTSGRSPDPRRGPGAPGGPRPRISRLRGTEPDTWVPVPRRSVAPSPSCGVLSALQYRAAPPGGAVNFAGVRGPHWRGPAGQSPGFPAKNFGPTAVNIAGQKIGTAPGGPRGSPELQGVRGESLGQGRGPKVCREPT